MIPLLDQHCHFATMSRILNRYIASRFHHGAINVQNPQIDSLQNQHSARTTKRKVLPSGHTNGKKTSSHMFLTRNHHSDSPEAHPISRFTGVPGVR